MNLVTHEAAVGRLTLVSDGARLAGIYFDGHKPGGPPADAAKKSDAVLDEARRQLDAYFAQRRTSFDLPLLIAGTPFQNSVWRALQSVPFGETRTYGQIANAIDAAAAVRAVGAAIGRNRLSIIIPCHRIIGANGAMTGFAGGVERKTFLLAHEGRPPAALGVRADSR